MISCLTITQPGRLPELSRAVACFRSQTLKERELVIVHDGDEDFHQSVQQLLECEPGYGLFQVHRVPSGRTLGDLRNVAVGLAKYSIVCQWDDDDLYHPRRLEVQFAFLKIKGADFCFLTDQLHLFESERILYWDDWNRETYPMNLIQGTLLGDKSLLGQYPALKRGEDTPVMMHLVRRGHKIAALGGMGWIYIYAYTGKNVWEREHHAAISAWKQLSGERLNKQIELLDARLREYPTDFGPVSMPCENKLLKLHIGIQPADGLSGIGRKPE
ncbi:MAG: glycosyltransferase family 2 protein [Gammaproteobacteria bacterium]